MLSSDLPLCYQFQIQMQNSSLWNLTFPPLPFLCLSLFSLSRLGFPSFHSLSPFHLIPSCSQVAFSISERFEANASHKSPPTPHPPPGEWTLGLLTFFSLLSIFLLTVSSILHLSLPLLPPPGLAYLAQFLFLLDVLFWLEKLVSGQGWSKSFVTRYSLLGLSLSVSLFDFS